MDILIKNMEMPKDEGVFLIIDHNGIIRKQIGTSGKKPIYRLEDKATAIELPEHGDLIDRDKEIDEWEQTRRILSECGQKHTFEYRKACVVINALSQAEVVLERTT